MQRSKGQSHSITSSVRNRNISGTAIPNALAGFKLTARSILHSVS